MAATGSLPYSYVALDGYPLLAEAGQSLEKEGLRAPGF